VTAACPGFVNTGIARATRFTGGNEDPELRRKLVEGFARAHAPQKVGSAIVDAIATNRAFVPVGFEAVLCWYAHRLVPITVQQRFARLGRRR
jgi:hypothetical protein